MIKYALDSKTNDIVYIDDAERKRVYKCQECRKQLILVKGDEKEYHYRHKVDSNCSGGQETITHQLARRFICEASEILTPDGVLTYTNARTHKKLGSIVPDVTVYVKRSPLYFEICVTHPVDEFKESIYR